MQWAVVALFCLFVLENEIVARTFVSEQTWGDWLRRLGGSLQRTPNGLLAIASLTGPGLFSLLVCAGVNVIGAGLAASQQTDQTSAISRSRAEPKSRGQKSFALHSGAFGEAFAAKCRVNAYWTFPLAVWALGWIVSLIFSGLALTGLLVLTAKLATAATLAGWLWETLRGCWVFTPFRANQRGRESPQRSRRIVLVGMLVYLVIFVGMNWGLWFNLQLPHGDSSMYEEHLWNVLHGKGFRSYLDQGLFLGEHIQVVHLLLLPLYVFWPSHLFMELSESAALAAGAIPVLWIARRHGRSEFAATLVALAYLLYFPMHYLDIAIDLKTFRPSAFGIPALLFMIDAGERRRWGWLSFWVAIALSCQEDFGVAIAPYGLWLMAESWWKLRPAQESSWREQMIVGTLLAVLIPAYVIFAVKVAIPWFHEGATVHYASYFQAFGKTPVEIVLNILTNPVLLWTHLVTAGSIALFLDLLLPLGMPLRAWQQLLIGVPLFILLCLNELTKSFPGPFHHFHAALIPALLWGACSSLGTMKNVDGQAQNIADQRGLWIFCCALTTTFFFSLSPLGIQFWDADGPYYWRKLYVPDERAREFAKVWPLIPTSARVASTDFIHPRFTHYARSYDYSHYPRRVANYEDKVPDDTDYIVIDTRHRYSDIQHYAQTREFKHQRDQWEELPVDTKGYFIVLKRIKRPEDPRASSQSK